MTSVSSTVASATVVATCAKPKTLTKAQKAFFQYLTDNPRKLELLMAWAEKWTDEKEIRAEGAFESKAINCAHNLAVSILAGDTPSEDIKDFIDSNANAVTLLDLSVTHLCSTLPNDVLQRVIAVYQGDAATVTKRVSDIIKRFPHLISLDLRDTTIGALDSHVLPKTLQFLYLRNCKNCTDLKRLHLDDCPELKGIDVSGASLKSLEGLQNFRDLSMVYAENIPHLNISAIKKATHPRLNYFIADSEVLQDTEWKLAEINHRP